MFLIKTLLDLSTLSVEELVGPAEERRDLGMSMGVNMSCGKLMLTQEELLARHKQRQASEDESGSSKSGRSTRW